MPSRDEITLAGMRVHALVGALAHEREGAQPVAHAELRVARSLSFPAGGDDA